MKISVQFEANSPEELQAILAAFHVKPAIIEQYPQLDDDRDLDELVKDLRAARTPAEPTVVREAERAESEVLTPLIQEPETVHAPEPVAAEAPVKAKRGRKPKMQPVQDDDAEPEQEAVIEVQQPEPVSGPSRTDLSATFNEYIRQYGHFGFNDVSTLLQNTFGENVRKASDVSDENLAKAISVVKQAVVENPFNRKTAYAN